MSTTGNQDAMGRYATAGAQHNQNTPGNPATMRGIAGHDGPPGNRRLIKTDTESNTCISIHCRMGYCIVRPTKAAAVMVIGCVTISAIVVAVYYYVPNKDRIV